MDAIVIILKVKNNSEAVENTADKPSQMFENDSLSFMQSMILRNDYTMQNGGLQ